MGPLFLLLSSSSLKRTQTHKHTNAHDNNKTAKTIPPPRPSLLPPLLFVVIVALLAVHIDWIGVILLFEPQLFFGSTCDYYYHLGSLYTFLSFLPFLHCPLILSSLCPLSNSFPSHTPHDVSKNLAQSEYKTIFSIFRFRTKTTTPFILDSICFQYFIPFEPYNPKHTHTINTKNQCQSAMKATKKKKRTLILIQLLIFITI